ncbi:hypothetical protein BP6252_11738 [Coleophoma cylindrospora]|uniref:Actin-like ATPase domain-containing protein n=1 Tax=Coleophoma cylindrospora TaxID=1849047 RepID=A0A3D8QKH1_9HELO|nr:hypothetical protein BP6252_11738 [Coleophoma cylindrospora]
MSTYPEEDDAQHFLAIGIDFGTTFSGVAYALSNKPKAIEVISDWESEIDHNSDSAKVPSKISYSEDGNVVSWGFDHDPLDKQFSWFKLLLSKETAEQRRDILGSMEADMKSLRKDPVDVVADYLNRLWEHASGVLKGKLGEYLFECLPIRMVLTVPAVWDHAAQELTRTAAKKAGLVSRANVELTLVSEPEAAARYILNDSIGLNVGDSFVLCDAGGGTVDLISYTVKDLKPLRLEMCAVATGDVYGAVVLDNAFVREVKGVIGVETYNDLSIRSKKKMMGDWEHGIKRNFKHKERAYKDWIVDIPGYIPVLPPPPYSPTSSTGSSSTGPLTPQSTGSTADGIWRSGSIASIRNSARPGTEPGMIRLKTAQLNSIFEEVCPRIVDLVQKQIEGVKKTTYSDPKAIFLVGGFGANRYLKEELQLKFPKITIQQPRDAWSAICRGAVQKAISDETVTNHIAKYHYGVTCRRTWDETKHLEEDKSWDAKECCWIATGQMDWYIFRGENITKTKPIRHGFYITVTEAAQLKHVLTHIYFSASSTAAPRLEPDVLPLCSMVARFDTKVFETLPEKTNRNGVKYRKLAYEIEMKVSSGSLEWSLDFEGMKKGQASIAIYYQEEKV